MRLTNEAKTLNIGGATERTAFKFETSGIAYRVLIDKLYSDKITSIVRELTANAYDSQRELGNPHPFFVHVPITSTPEFYVRDYGVGMSHEKVMNLYSTVFGSDKRDTDQLVGSFGLGSKSPFAYTSQFNVSCYDGTNARHYAAGIGPDGVPQIALLGSEPSTETLGVRVGFNVEHGDFGNFKKALQNVALGYREKAFETNASEVTFSFGKRVLKGDSWASYENCSLGEGWSVRQGCVLYPLSTDISGLKVPPKSYKNGARRYIIDVPIGACAVTPSREHLEYTKPVIEYLNDRISKIKKEIKTAIWNEVKNIRNVAEFFDRVQHLKPPFINDTFIHPFTGAQSTDINVDAPSCFYTVKRGEERWSYTVRQAIACQKTRKPISTDMQETAYIIDDVAPFLDSAREVNSVFSMREHRRLARVVRMWMEKCKLDNAAFWLAPGVSGDRVWDDDFISMVAPNTKIVRMSAQDLINAVPKRKDDKPLDMVVRGIAMVKGESSHQQTVVALQPGEHSCWVSAEDYRREGGKIRKFYTFFGLNELYICSSVAQKRILQTGIPRLDHAVEKVALEKWGINWREIVDLSQFLNNYYAAPVKQIATFVRELDAAHSPSLGRIMRLRSMLGDVARALKPYLGVPDEILIASENFRAVIKLLNANADRQDEKSSEAFKVLNEFGKIAEGLPKPLTAFLEFLNNKNCLGDERLEPLAEALIGLFQSLNPLINRKKT